MMDVRGSEMYAFLSCRKRWDYEYVQEIEAIRQNDKLYFGTLFHKFLEVLYRTNSYHDAFHAGHTMLEEMPADAMPDTEYHDIRELFNSMVDVYCNYWADRDSRRETLATELKFRVPMPGIYDTYYTGTVDHVFVDRDTDKVWLEDHKTVAYVEKYVGASEYDRQITRYLWAFDQLAEGKGEILVEGVWTKSGLSKPAGMIYNIIGKRLPEPPKLIRNGTMLSKDMAQRTTYDLYYTALVNAGLVTKIYGDVVAIPKEYDAILAHLRAQETEDGNPYFRRIRSYRNDAEKRALVKEMVGTISDMKDARLSKRFYRNFSQACAYCPMKTLCVAEQDGSDAERIRESMYRPKNGNNQIDIEEVV